MYELSQTHEGLLKRFAAYDEKIVFGEQSAQQQVESDRRVFAMRDELTKEYGSKEGFLDALAHAVAAVESESHFLNSLKGEPGAADDEIALQEREVLSVKARLDDMRARRETAQW